MISFSKILFFLLFTPIVFADTTPPQNTAPTAPADSMLAQCPAPNVLKKDPKTAIWTAPGGWQSYQSSFADQIGGFLGAQWEGVAVGQVVCLYQPKNQFAFAVQLYYNKVAYEPKSGAWSKNLKGYRNCTSHTLQDCVFYIKVKEDANADMYQSLEDYKKNHTASQDEQPAF